MASAWSAGAWAGLKRKPECSGSRSIFSPRSGWRESNRAAAEGVTATDLVLHITQLLRAQKVVGKFVEFYGEGAASLPVPDRATIGNMAPEYGATMGFFPVDRESVKYLRATGRTDEQCAAFENYFRAQKMFGMPRPGRDRL